MFTGIILAVLVLFLAGRFLWNRMNIRNDKRMIAVMSMVHKVIGIILIFGILIHMSITFSLLKQRPVMMFLLGWIMFFASIVCGLGYVLRKKIGSRWIQIHRYATAVILVCLIIHVIYGISSLNSYQQQVQNIQIPDRDVSDIADGSYDGECNVGYIYAHVRVTVANGRMEQVELLEHRTERGKKAESIVNDMVREQKVKVDAVTQATNSSKVIMQAVTNALEGKGVAHE